MVAAGGTTLLPSSMKSLGLRVCFFSRAADGVKTLVEKRRNVRLGLRPSAAPPSRGAGGARASRCPLLPAWRDITKQPRRRRSCSCCLAIAEARALPQQTKLASRLSQPSVNSPRAREWNMATGSGTGQQRASFSTSCLPVTWFNIKRLFYSNWPRRLFLLAVKCSPALVSRRLMFFFCLIFFPFSFFSFRRPIVTKTRDTDPIKLLCKSTGHFEYVYKDKYFYNSYEWTRKEKIVYFFHRYFINTVLYLCDEMWFYEVWNNCFSFFLFSFGLLFSMLLNFNLEQMHLVVDGLFLLVCLFVFLREPVVILTSWEQHTHVKEAFTGMHCYCMSCLKIQE